MKTLKLIILISSIFLLGILSKTNSPESGIQYRVVNPKVKVSRPPKYMIKNRMPLSEFNNVCNDAALKGYKPVSIDVYLHNEGSKENPAYINYVNIILEKNDQNNSFHTISALNNIQLTRYIKQWKSSGYQMSIIESYNSITDSLHYAAIFTKQSAPEFKLLTNIEFSAWHNTVQSNIAQGYRLVNKSIAFDKGKPMITALFYPEKIGAWMEKSNQDLREFECEIETSAGNGLKLSHLEVTQFNNGRPNFFSTYDSVQNSDWYVLSLLELSELEYEIEDAIEQGYQVEQIVSYDIKKYVRGIEQYDLRFTALFSKT